MIVTKGSLIGSINSKHTLSGELNKSVEYLEPVTQEKLVDPTTEIQEVTPDKEYTGLSKVTVNKVTSEIDNNIKPENIKEGVDILGVSGNVEEINTTEIRITPISEEQTIIPEEPYNGFNKVTVNKVTSNIDENITPQNIKEGVDILGVVGTFAGGGGDEELATSYLSSIDGTLGANVTKLPNGLTSLGTHAFYCRTNLTLTSLPNTITSIGEYAFTSCSNLALTSLPDGLVSIGQYGFAHCGKMALIELPNTLTTLGTYAFYDCSNLALKSLPESLLSIGTYVFYGCSNLALTSLPSGLTTVSNNVFQNCTNLALTSLPSGLTSIGSNSFYGCMNLKITELPNTLTTIGNAGFRDCYEMQLTKLSDSLTSIGTYTFYQCRAMTITEVPSGITKIPNYAFYNCTSLTELTFKGAITSIGNTVFNTCRLLEKVAFPNVTTVPTLGSGVFTSTPIASGTGYIYVPDTLVDSFKSATNWSTYADQIKGVSEL